MKYRATKAFISKAEIAHKRLEQMSMEDCIKAEIEGISIVDFADDEPAPAPAPAPESAPAKPKIHTLHFVEL